MPWPQRLARAGEALLALDIFFCPLALGCARLSAMAIAAALACLAFACLALGRLLERRAMIFPLPALLFAAAALAIGLQLCPLPPGLIALVAPGSAALFEAALGPLGLYPAWRPLSLDPPATARALLALLACLMAFAAAAQIATSHSGRARLMGAIGLSALAVALIGFGHALAGARLLFGRFAYVQAAPPFLSTFGNPNHLAASLTLGGLALSALALDAQARRARCACWLAYLIVASAIFLSLSRGGITAFLIGQALLAWNWRARNTGDAGGGGPRHLQALFGLAASAAIALYLAAQRLFGEWSGLASLEGLQNSKLSLIGKAAPMLRAHWQLGVGRGAFEPAFTRFLDAPDGGARTFTHPENLFFQWAIELGLPLGILFLSGLACCLWMGCRQARRCALRWGALIAAFAIGLHELADFSLEFLGVALPVSAILAVGVSHRRTRLKMPALACLGMAALAAAICAASFFGARADLRRDGQALLTAQSLNRQAVLAVLDRHPADYFPRLVAAQQALAADRPGEALTWAGQAMYLYPALAAPHAVAARALEQMGAFAQAGTEWKLSMARGDFRAGERLAALFRLGRLTAADLTRFAPEAPAIALRLARQLFDADRADLAQVLLDHLDEAEGVRALDRLCLRARIAARQRNPAALLALGEEIEAIEGTSGTRGILFQVQALVAQGQEAAARARLADSLHRQPRAPLAIRLAELELWRGDTDAARSALRQLPAAPSISERVRALVLEAAAARRDGAHAKALAPLRTAVNLKPADADLRLNLAEALVQAGRFDEALREIRRCRGQSAARAQRIEALEAQIAAQRARLDDAARRRAFGLHGESASPATRERFP